MINAKDFARAYSKQYGVPYKYAQHDCDKFWELLGKLLYEDKENITIYGVGAFKHKKNVARQVRHPGTKELITIPESRVIKFVEKNKS